MVTNFIIINYKSVIAIKLQIRYSYFELIIIVSLEGGEGVHLGTVAMNKEITTEI
jgi:hypothetical protein